MPVLLDFGLTKRFTPAQTLAFARLVHASEASDIDGLLQVRVRVRASNPNPTKVRVSNPNTNPNPSLSPTLNPKPSPNPPAVI